MATQRSEWTISGRVQGVGFRYTARQLAEDGVVTGYVRNQPDGTVFMVVEGAEAECAALLKRLRASRVGPNIQDLHEDIGPATGDFNSFTIRF